MVLHWIDVQLNIDASAGTPQDAAYLWFNMLTERIAGAERSALADLPAAAEMAADSSGGRGEPGRPFGVIEIQRTVNGIDVTTRRRTLSTAGMAWLRDEIAEFPYKVTITIGHFTEDGDGLDVYKWEASAPAPSLGWLKLQATFRAGLFTDAAEGAAQQRQWLDALYAVAEQVNPGFGQISYSQQRGKTTLELLKAPIDIKNPEHRHPDWAIGRNRDLLRGYAWLTIVAQELADKLGGAAALAATGVFAEVKQLSRGGVWLRATDDFNQYGMAEAEAVFGVLAPVLSPGKPRRPQPNAHYGEAPMFVVFEDPAERTARP